MHCDQFPNICTLYFLFEKYMYTGRSEILFVVHVLNKSIACICRMMEKTFH